LWEDPGRCIVNWKRERDYEYTQNLTPTLWAWEFLRRNPDYRDSWETGDESRAQEWGLARLVDPDERSPEGLRFNMSFGGMIIGERNFYLTVPLGHVYYDFDITKPLPPQLQKAGSDLRLVRDMEDRIGEIPSASDSRMRTDKWPEYFRLLDAAAAEASRQEIAAELYPNLTDEHGENEGQKAVSKRLLVAKEMARHGYRKILLVRE